MQSKDRHNAASGQLDRVLGFFARVEAKASFIFAVDSSILGLTALNFRPGDLTTWYIVLPATVTTLLIFASLFFVYRCSFPTLKGGSSSIVYFQEIAKRREAEYLEQFEQADEKSLTRDFAAQVWRNSEILSMKFRAIKIAFILTALALVPWFALLAASAIVHPAVTVGK